MQVNEGYRLSEIFCLHTDFHDLSGIVSTAEQVSMASKAVPVTTHMLILPQDGGSSTTMVLSGYSLICMLAPFQ